MDRSEREFNASAPFSFIGLVMLFIGVTLQVGAPMALIVLGALLLFMALLDPVVQTLRGTK